MKIAVPFSLVNRSPTPLTLYQDTSVGTFIHLEGSAVEPTECNLLKPQTTRKKQKPKVSDQFNLDNMDLFSQQSPAGYPPRWAL